MEGTKLPSTNFTYLLTYQNITTPMSSAVFLCYVLQQLWSALYQSWQRYLPTHGAVWKEIKEIKEHDTQLRNHVVRLRKYAFQHDDGVDL